MPAADLAVALGAIPEAFRVPLISEFERGLDEYRASDWEKVGLKAGKFCEIVYGICRGHADGSYAAVPSKPSNFPQACRDLERFSSTKGRSLCMQIPKVLIALYELRNNRSIGHISAEISPNHMDADFFIRGMKWVMAELVRNFSPLAIHESHTIVEAITSRTFHIVWSNGDARRVLEPARTASEKTLILLYSEEIIVNIDDLQRWVEYKNGTNFRRGLLKELHKKAFIHYNEDERTAQILPPGRLFVEESGLLIVSR